MSLSLDTLQTPKPSALVLQFEGDDLHVTYDRAAFTGAVVSSVFLTPVRARLGLVLLDWDLLKDGKPWQPAPLSDPQWTDLARARRLARATATKRSSVRAAAEATGGETDMREIDTLELTDDERAGTMQTPISAAERREAYAKAWDNIFELLPRDFLRAVDQGILDDFLGAGWRR